MAGERAQGRTLASLQAELARALQPMLRFYRQQLGAEASQELADALGTSSLCWDPDRWYSVELFRDMRPWSRPPATPALSTRPAEPSRGPGDGPSAYPPGTA